MRKLLVVRVKGVCLVGALRLSKVDEMSSAELVDVSGVV